MSGALLPLAAVPLQSAVVLACALFAIGIVGVTCRRNVLIILLSVEIMLNAANLALVAFSRVHGDVTGQVFVFFSMTVAAAEVAVGLAIVIALYRLRRTVDAGEVRELHEVDYGPLPVLRLEGEDQHHHDADDAVHEGHVEKDYLGVHGEQAETAGAGHGSDHGHGHGPAAGGH